MAKADISLRGRAYSIACSPGQEGRIVTLGSELDARMRQVSGAVGDIGDERLLLLVSLSLLDELDAARQGLPTPPPPQREETGSAAVIDQLARRLEALARRLEDGR